MLLKATHPSITLLSLLPFRLLTPRSNVSFLHLDSRLYCAPLMILLPFSSLSPHPYLTASTQPASTSSTCNVLHSMDGHNLRRHFGRNGCIDDGGSIMWMAVKRCGCTFSPFFLLLSSAFFSAFCILASASS